MKLAVYGEKEEDKVFLRLRKMGDGITVEVVDINGNPRSGGRLMEFAGDETVYLFPDIPKDFGFNLDAGGFLRPRQLSLQ